MVNCRWREILLEWEYDKNYEQNFQIVQVEVLPPKKKKKVCQFCKRRFNSGKALGGHIRIHNEELRPKNYSSHSKMEEGSSSAGSKIYDRLGFLSESWRFRQKRSSRPVLRKDKAEAEVNNGGQEIEAVDSAADEEETDHDEESAMLESLKELAGSSKHQITRTGKRYVCMFCDIDFPTFHAARVHVSEAIGAETITEVEAAAAEGSEGSGSVNQTAAEASGNRKQFEFDLNELPPVEDDDA